MKRYGLLPKISSNYMIVYAEDVTNAYEKFKEYVCRMSESEFREFVSKIIDLNECTIDPEDVLSDEDCYIRDEDAPIVLK